MELAFFEEHPVAPTWQPELLSTVIRGGGFEIRSTSRAHEEAGGPRPRPREVVVRARRAATLADTVGGAMRLLLVGLNPSPRAAASGIPFSGPANRGWPALLASGLAERSHDPVALLVDRDVGMTDLVKRTTARASKLTGAEYAAGLERLEGLCAWLRPGAVCVVGLSGWRAAVDRRARAGEQERTIGGRPVWLMPNPSGLNTHVGLEELVEHLRSAAELADRCLPRTTDSAART